MLGAYGKTLIVAKRYPEAESALREAHSLYQTKANSEGIISMTRSLCALYESWHDAEPGNGYDANAIEWRAKLRSGEVGAPKDDAR